MDQTAALQEALAHHQAGRIREARAGYEKVLRRDPDDLNALHLLGVLENQTGHRDAAIRHITRALELQPDFAEAQNSLGNVHKDREDWPAAEAAYTRAIEINPDFAGAYLNLGLVARQRGDLTGALEACERAIAIDPAFAPAHFNRANALRELGRLDEAATAYRDTVAKEANFADARHNLAITLQALGNEHLRSGAWNAAVDSYREAMECGLDEPPLANNLGNALKNMGRLAEAVDAFALALKADPDYAAAHNNLGTVHETLGEPEAAIDSYRRALEIDPNFTAALNNLGNALRAVDRPDDAVAAYEKALAVDPDFLDAQFNLGHAHKETGDFTRAERAYDLVLSMAPDHPGALRQLASLGVLAGRAVDVNRLRTALNGEMKDSNRAELAFALAKIDEDMGRTDDMFAMLALGNAAKRRTIDYDVADDGRRMQAIADAFTAARLAHSGSGDPDAAPIFIVGMPRSGTSLVEQILASHPDVFGAGELMFIADVAGHGAFPENLGEIGESEWSGLGQAYMESLRARAPAAVRITDKMPHNFLYLGLIRMILPNAKIVHCTRTAEDTCLSLYKTLFTDRLDFAYDMTELGTFFGHYADLMDHWRTVMPDGFLDLSYEALVADQEGETRRLLDYLDLTWDDACLDFHNTQRRVTTASSTQVRQKLYSRSAGAWRQHAGHMAPLLDALPADRRSDR